MIEVYSKYDNMHKNGIFYALIYINNHIIISINCKCMAHKGANHLSAMHAHVTPVHRVDKRPIM